MMITLFTKHNVVLCQSELQFSEEEMVPWMNQMKSLLYYYAIRAKCPSDAGSCSAFKDMDDTYVTHRLTVFFIIHLTVFIFRTDYGATYTGAVGLFPNYFPSIKKRSKTY